MVAESVPMFGHFTPRSPFKLMPGAAPPTRATSHLPVPVRMLPTSLWLLLIFILPAASDQVPLVHSANAVPNSLTLHLRHLHSANSTNVLFADVPPQNGFREDLAPYVVKSQMLTTHRPSSFAAHSRARLKAFSGSKESEVDDLVWGEESVTGPDVTSRETLLHLAKMTNNAYAYPEGGDRKWYDLGGNWNIVRVFCPCSMRVSNPHRRAFPLAGKTTKTGFEVTSLAPRTTPRS